MPEGRETGRIGDRYQLDYYRHPRRTRSWKWPATAAATLAALLGAGALFGVWGEEAFQAAPVAGVHSAFGDDCRKCHDAAWQPAVRFVTGGGDYRSVSNSSCRACHEETADHHWAGSEVGEAKRAGPACAACHTEHRPEQNLRSVADSFCLSCHRDLEAHGGGTGAFANWISGFSAGRDPHPEFAILRKASAAPASNHRVWAVGARVDAPTGMAWRDAGGLIFNHGVHLAEEGVLGKDRKPRVLQCSQCHVPAADGTLMAPVNYERHCRECHPLQLGGSLARFGEIAHESPTIIRGLLRERLANERADPSGAGSTDSELPIADARRTLLPSPARVPRDRAEVIDAELNDVDHALFGLEAKGFCRKCHHLQADGRVWQVLMSDPAISSRARGATAPGSMVPERWFRHGRFNHEKHRVAAECADCHQTRTSTSTADVLLPSIDACRRCHGSEASTVGVNAGDRCTQCHQYHTSDLSVHP